MRNYLIVTLAINLFFVSNIRADVPKWHQHPGNWFKNVFSSPKKGKKTPDISVVDINGTAFSLQDAESQYVLLTFWASWCSFCKKDIPEIEKLRDSWAAHDVSIYAVNVHDDVETAKEFIETTDIQLEFLFDVDGKTAKKYAISPLPANFLIEAESGKIIKKWKGRGDVEKIDRFIKSMTESE